MGIEDETDAYMPCPNNNNIAGDVISNISVNISSNYEGGDIDISDLNS